MVVYGKRPYAGGFKTAPFWVSVCKKKSHSHHFKPHFYLCRSLTLQSFERTLGSSRVFSSKIWPFHPLKLTGNPGPAACVLRQWTVMTWVASALSKWRKFICTLPTPNASWCQRNGSHVRTRGDTGNESHVRTHWEVGNLRKGSWEIWSLRPTGGMPAKV